MRIICTENEKEKILKEIITPPRLFCEKISIEDCFNSKDCKKCAEKTFNIKWEITD